MEACIFHLMQIGELTTKLDPNYRSHNPSVPWRDIMGLRNRIVHHYEGINLSVIWDVIKHDLPMLLENLRSV